MELKEKNQTLENSNADRLPGRLKAYAQWATFTITATTFKLAIRNASHSWGKFYDILKGKDEELSPEFISQVVIDPKKNFAFGACGREHSPSGTTGNFELWDAEREVLIGTYSWDCPWGKKENESQWNSLNEDYVTQIYPQGNLDSGALGNIGLKCARI